MTSKTSAPGGSRSAGTSVTASATAWATTFSAATPRASSETSVATIETTSSIRRRRSATAIATATAPLPVPMSATRRRVPGTGGRSTSRVADLGDGKLDEPLRLWPRDERSPIDGEGEAHELLEASDVRHRLAGRPPLDEGPEPLRLAVTDGRPAIGDDPTAIEVEDAPEEQLGVEPRRLAAGVAQARGALVEQGLDGEHSGGLSSRSDRRAEVRWPASRRAPRRRRLRASRGGRLRRS